MQPCGFTLQGETCQEVGDHFCELRALHIKKFIETALVHTKGKFARRQFLLARWQYEEIIRPLFGETEWSDEHQCYRRRYRIAWIEMARKALDVDTPILTANRGWVRMADVVVGDVVFGVDGNPEPVTFVSDVFTEPTFRVSTRYGKSLVAGADHDWIVKDRRRPRGGLRQPDGTRLPPEYLLTSQTTAEMAAGDLQDKRGLYRWALPRNGSLKLDSPQLPIDPYCLGAWLGDGTSKSGAMTAHEDDQPFMRAQFEAAGYETRSTSISQVFYVQKFMTGLRKLGVLHNKHVPEQYLMASEADRLDLLRGLMDTDGWATIKGKSLSYGFCSKNRQMADSVEFLARSVGYNPWRGVKRVDGHGEYDEVLFAAVDGLPSPHRMPRKADKPRETKYRSADDSIVSIEPAGTRQTRCLGVESGEFLAGRDLMPTANCGKSELLAAVMLYIFFCDGEYSAELFSVATDRKQASLIFDVAMQMILLNPRLAKECKVIPSQKRIVRVKTNSVYQVLANDAGSALGSNPSAVAADEILAWNSGGMWTAMRSGQGSMARVQPLLIAATTAGSDTESFGGQEHAEMEKVLADPERSRHIFVFMRNTPQGADPFKEENWYYANPALGDFLSLEAMREMANEAKNSASKLNGFLQFQLNMWTSGSVAWMPMHLWDDQRNVGVKFKTAEDALNHFAGRECWFGLDLAARQDLTSICYLFPSDDGSVDVIWRHYLPEKAVDKLDRMNSGRFTNEFVKGGWLTVTEGDVLDFQKVYEDIECDARRFTILGGDADKWSSDPVIQEIESRTYVSEIFAYANDFSHMSDSMHRIFEMVTEGRFRHHGNPLARFCFDACQARIAAYDPDLLRPDKPVRNKDAKRIDAVPAAIMAVNAWHTRGGGVEAYAGGRDVIIL